MTVPITSDLVGYTAFWSSWLAVALLIVALGALAITLLLAAILWRVW